LDLIGVVIDQTVNEEGFLLVEIGGFWVGSNDAVDGEVEE
jgi:hypothetical protein